MKTQSLTTLLGLVYCSLALSSLCYAADSYKDATVDEIGIHIVTNDGRSVVLKKDADQVAFDTVRISPDSGSVG